MKNKDLFSVQWAAMCKIATAVQQAEEAEAQIKRAEDALAERQVEDAKRAALFAMETESLKSFRELIDSLKDFSLENALRQLMAAMETNKLETMPFGVAFGKATIKIRSVGIGGRRSRIGGDYIEDSTQVKKAIREGFNTSTKIASVTGLTKGRILYVVNKLAENGTLRKNGERRSANYTSVGGGL